MTTSLQRPELALFRTIVALLGCGACGVNASADRAEMPELVRADKGAHDAAARSGVFAFLDGFEAASDPSVVGVDVRVVDHGGDVLLASPSAGGVRGLVLLDDAVATLELSSTIADQHVVIRPFAGGAIAIEHRYTPLALAAIGNELVWVEARVAWLEDADGDGVKDTALIDLTVVEADARGDVVSRIPVTTPGGVRISPWGAFVPFPAAFGLLVEADVAHLGWTTVGRSSEVFRIDRRTGSTTVEWRGRGRTTDMDLAEVGEALGLLDGELVVAGGIYEYAAVIATGGFVAHRGATIYTPDPVRHAAGDGTTFFVARRNILERFDGTVTPLAFEAPEVVEGLALDDSNLVMTTDSALYVVPL